MSSSQQPSGEPTAYDRLDRLNQRIVNLLKYQNTAGNLQIDLMNETLQPWIGFVVPGSPRRDSSPEGEAQQTDPALEDDQPTAPSISEADVQEAVDAQLLGEGEADVETDTHQAEEGSGSDSNESSLSDVPSSFDERAEPDLTRTRSPAGESEGFTEILDRHYDADMSDFARGSQEGRDEANHAADGILIGEDRLEKLLVSEELQETPEPFSGSASPLLNALNITKLQGFIEHATQKANAIGDPIIRQAMITLLKRSAHNPDLLNLFAATVRREKTTAQAKDFEILLKYKQSRIDYENRFPEWYADLPLGTRQKLALWEEPFDGNYDLHDTAAKAKDLWDERQLENASTSYTIAEERPPCLAMNLILEQAMLHPFVMTFLDEPARANIAAREKVFQVYLKFAKQEVEKPGSRTKWFAQPDQPNNQDNAETPIEARVQTPVEAQVEAQAEVEAQLKAPIEAPVEAPVEVPVETSVEAPVEAQDSDAELPPRPPRKKRRVGSTAVVAKTVVNEGGAATSPDVHATESPYSLRGKTPRRLYGKASYEKRR
ncbi:MAG: hypothetical protein Q9221_006861 [Calogaya cf. arnoldii]